MRTNKTTPVQPGAGQVNPAVTSGSYPPTPPPTTDRPDRPEWTAAKDAGDVGEQLVADVLRSIGLLIQQHRGHAPHDLTISGGIEVKNDQAALRTGNVAVEIAYRGHAAGITTSTASGWAYVVGNEVLLCPTAALRELIRRGNYRQAKAGENAIVVLVPLADLRRVARSIIIGEGVRR